MVCGVTPTTPPTETDLRPHFDMVLDCPPERVLTSLDEHFSEVPWEGDMRGGHVQISVPKTDRHLWSPWLTFEVRCDGDKCRLEGRFAPHPGAWTLYIAGYAILGFVALGLSFFGFSQWVADQPPTALWGVPVVLVMVGLLYGLAFIGQGLTGRQMYAMRTFVESAVHDAEAKYVRTETPERPAQ